MTARCSFECLGRPVTNDDHPAQPVSARLTTTLGVSRSYDLFDASTALLWTQTPACRTTTTTWSYDAAGNRNDATVVDNLNRATTIGGVSRTYDILGNTLTKGSISMTWDVLNRMTGLGSQSYYYRADGMRTKKAVGQTWTSYRYDGQMPIEEYNDGPGQPRSFLQTIRYGLGARGIDYIERITNASVVTKGYPVYDAHGNNVATLQKSGTSYSLSDQRSYDAWGGVRTGSTTGEPNARYCANLGHLADDESGFIYMRARYYEPAVGRFVSEDPAMEGANWFGYCANDPINLVDQRGTNVAGVLYVLANFVATLLFTGIAYVLMVRYYEYMFPGYRGGGAMQGALFAAGTAILGTVGGFGLGAGEPAAAEDLGSFVRRALKALKNPEVLGGVARAVGIGALVGTITGVCTAVYEFLLSDFYANFDGNA